MSDEIPQLDAVEGLLDAEATPETLTASAKQQIELRISTLHLAPGTTVTERELATELGMSKAPVREALLQLSSSGLIAPRTGSGYLITPITLRQTQSLFELWLGLEHSAVMALRSRPLDAERAELLTKQVDVLHQLIASTREAGVASVTLLEMALHLLLISSADSPMLLRAWPRIEIMRLLQFATDLGADTDCGHETHAELAAAMVAGDIDTASRLSAQHIGRIQQRVLNALMASSQVQDINLV